MKRPAATTKKGERGPVSQGREDTLGMQYTILTQRGDATGAREHNLIFWLDCAIVIRRSFGGACFNMLTKLQKKRAINTVARHDTDTGSPEVQISVLTRQIDALSTHLKKNHKDRHSRRGLLKMVADRRTHIKYLEQNDTKAYNKVVKELGLKK